MSYPSSMITQHVKILFNENKIANIIESNTRASVKTELSTNI